MLWRCAAPVGTIVVVEDDPHIAELVDLYLRREGFRVLCAGDGARGLEVVDRERPRLVVLDLGLPGELGGLEVCRRIRQASAVPVVMLTARDEEIDRVLGFELGADDYVTKPFSPRELVARIKAILRRAESPAEPAQTLSIGGVEIDVGRHEARIAGQPVPLAAREFDLLVFLAEHHGLALSRRQLLDGAWGPGWYGDERTVDVHVRQLRKKFGAELPLTTVWGVGYRLG
jgi:DNA-binding response OmpR family regulator